jgi:hypothetical protein
VCTSAIRLDFLVDVIYNKDGELDDHTAEEFSQRPFQNVELGELISLLAAPEINVEGVSVKLGDVRKAFAVDGAVHVFNMHNPLREDFLQTRVVFQVRTTGFAQKPVRVTATLIARPKRRESVLSKK